MPRVINCEFPKTEMTEFLSKGELSDVVVVSPAGKTFKLHRLMLAYKSGFFRHLFSSPSAATFKERSSNTIAIKCPDPGDVFPSIIEFLYKGTIDMGDLEHAVNVASVARYLQIDELVAHATTFVSETINPQTALSVLLAAVSLCEEGCRAFAIEVMARSFFDAVIFRDDDVISSIGYNEAVALLRHSKLQAICEEVVLRFVRLFLKANPSLTDGQKRVLWEMVFFENLDSDTLTSLEADVSVPRDLIYPAGFQRLRMLDAAAKNLSPPVNSRVRTSYCKALDLPGSRVLDVVPLATFTSSDNSVPIPTVDPSGGLQIPRLSWCELNFPADFLVRAVRCEPKTDNSCVITAAGDVRLHENYCYLGPTTTMFPKPTRTRVLTFKSSSWEIWSSAPKSFEVYGEVVL